MENFGNLRKVIGKSVRRLYFFDDDPDGLMSFLLLNKKYEYFDFECIKSSSHDENLYIEKIKEIDFDLAIVLDRPFLTQKVIDALKNVVWIDHHPPMKLKRVHYLNSRLMGGRWPTSYLCYKIIGDNSYENKLISSIGCISDYYLPDFIIEVKKKSGNLFPDRMDLDEINFNSKFGELIRFFSFILMGKEKEIRRNIEIVVSLNSIVEAFENEILKEHYERILKKYLRILKEVMENRIEIDKNWLLFIYRSEESFTGYLSNHLRYLFNKNVVVAKESLKAKRYTLSFRSTGTNLHGILDRAFKGLNGSFGGHENACGGNIFRDDFEIMINRLKEMGKEI